MKLAALLTLLELSGAQPKIDVNRAILVLIDYQNEYRTGKLPLYEVEAGIRSTQQLLKEARRRKIPVVHVVHRGTPGGLFDRATSAGQIFDELRPLAGEVVIEKTLPNAFAGTSLAEVLRQHPGRDQLLLAGLMSHMCLQSTASAAVDHGYFSTIAASTTTTRDLRGPHGERVAATMVTSAALAAMQDRFALIVNTPDDIFLTQ